MIFFRNIVFEIDHLIGNDNDYFCNFLREVLIYLIEKNNTIKFFFISKIEKLQVILQQHLAYDIAKNVTFAIFDEKNYINDLDFIFKKNNLRNDDTITFFTSRCTQIFLNRNHFFNVFIDCNTIQQKQADLILNKASYKKNILINSLIEELENIIFSFNSFINRNL